MLTADELDQVCDVLIEHEGLIPWLYCDSRGFVTVGVGDKVGAETMLTMPFVHQSNNKPAESDEKITAYARVQDFFHKGLTASAYSAVSDLRLPVDFCRRRLVYRLKSEFLPAVEKQCPQLATFPIYAKLALVDIAYNVGIHGFAAFTELIACCNSRHFAVASECVHTKKEGEDPKRPETWGKRNRWRRESMLLASTITRTTQDC
jgi:GH24 family phage-related lysozyme (muramidase)